MRRGRRERNVKPCLIARSILQLGTREHIRSYAGLVCRGCDFQDFCAKDVQRRNLRSSPDICRRRPQMSQARALENVSLSLLLALDLGLGYCLCRWPGFISGWGHLAHDLRRGTTGFDCFSGRSATWGLVTCCVGLNVFVFSFFAWECRDKKDCEADASKSRDITWTLLSNEPLTNPH